MDNRESLFTVECGERDGKVVRHVEPVALTIERLQLYWAKLSTFQTLFNRHIQNFNDFISTFLSQEPDGALKANGLVWQVDDVGIFWLTDIYPGYQATAHFTFWDRRFRGREELSRRMLQYVFDEFQFHRIITEVPLYSIPTIQAVEKVGFIKEGRLRKAAWYRESWWDVYLFSVLREEAHGLSETPDRDTAAKVTGDSAS